MTRNPTTALMTSAPHDGLTDASVVIGDGYVMPRNNALDALKATFWHPLGHVANLVMSVVGGLLGLSVQGLVSLLYFAFSGSEDLLVMGAASELLPGLICGVIAGPAFTFFMTHREFRLESKSGPLGRISGQDDFQNIVDDVMREEARFLEPIAEHTSNLWTKRQRQDYVNILTSAASSMEKSALNRGHTVIVPYADYQVDGFGSSYKAHLAITPTETRWVAEYHPSDLAMWRGAVANAQKM